MHPANQSELQLIFMCNEQNLSINLIIIYSSAKCTINKVACRTFSSPGPRVFESEDDFGKFAHSRIVPTQSSLERLSCNDL